MDNHNCIIINPRDTDYIADKNSPIVFKAANALADWSDHVDFFERQKIAFESDGCVFFTGQESFDAQMNNLIESGQIPQWLVDEFTSMGFMDPNSLDGKPRFHSSPRFTHVLSGVRLNGASLPQVWDMMRKYGFLPWIDLPFDDTTTIDQYFTPIIQAKLDKAARALALIGGKNAIQYRWIVNDGSLTSRLQDMIKMKAALPQAPLCIGTPVCEPWDQLQPPTCALTNPQHSTMVYRIDQFVEDFDHYAPFLKQLGLDYPIPYVLQGVLSVTPTPPAPAPLPPQPTNQQISTWLDSVRQWLMLILSSLKGRSNIGSTSMNTFWNWLAKSSKDPDQVALTVKGIVSAVLPVLLVFIHNPNLSSLPDDIYSLVVAFFAAYSAIATVIGISRKIYLTAFPPVAQ